MPAPYTSYITAIQGIYNEVLTPALFPGGTRPTLALDEASIVGPDGARQSPPYVIMVDEGSTPRWTFKAHPQGADPRGHNATAQAVVRLEAYAYDLGDCDRIIDVILWNGQAPKARAGLAFASLSLIAPQKGVAEFVIPGRSQSQYSGLQQNNQRVHVRRQWFQISTAISGDGL